MTIAAHRFNNDLRYRDDFHPNQVQLTPPYALEPIRAALGGVIELDPCTEPDNPTRAERFYCLPTDGAEQPWNAATIFVNPPYSAATASDLATLNVISSEIGRGEKSIEDEFPEQPIQITDASAPSESDPEWVAAQARQETER